MTESRLPEVFARVSDWLPELSLAGAARLEDDDDIARVAKRSEELDERRMVTV